MYVYVYVYAHVHVSMCWHIKKYIWGVQKIGVPNPPFLKDFQDYPQIMSEVERVDAQIVA